MTIIRHALESDLRALSHLAGGCFVDTFGHLYSEKNLLEHVEKTCSLGFFSQALLQDRMFVAEDDGLVGYIKFGVMGLPVKHLPDDSAEIHRLYVQPEFQGRGIGRKLMQYALEDPVMQESGHHYLSVYEDNISAQKFYKRYGFSVIGEYDYYVGSHRDREFIMHKTNS